jgi:hypothetical protein
MQFCNLSICCCAGSNTSVTFDVPESVPESDLEHMPGSPIENWEV